MSQAWQSWRRERREAPRRGRLGFLHLPCKREVKEEPITAGAEWGCREEKGRQNKREEGREKGRKEGERLREKEEKYGKKEDKSVPNNTCCLSVCESCSVVSDSLRPMGYCTLAECRHSLL